MQLVEPAPSLILQPGESQMVNLRVRPVPMFRVAGHAIAPSGGSARVMVSLDSADSSETYLPTTVAMVQADATGRFTFPAVPRGDYRLRVDTGIPVSLPNRLEYSVLWATQPLSVNADFDDVSLPLQRGPEVRGTIRFEGSSSAPTTGRILLSLESADGPGARRVTSGMMEVDAANHFSAVGMLPGRYFLRVALFPDGWRWRLKNAIAQGHDIASVPLVLGSALVDNLVVTFTDRQTDVTGVVRNPQGVEDGEASVLVFYRRAGPGEHKRDRTPTANRTDRPARKIRRARLAARRVFHRGSFDRPGDARRRWTGHPARLDASATTLVCRDAHPCGV